VEPQIVADTTKFCDQQICLGGFEMTLVVCWRQAEKVIVAADTRISQAGPSGGALPLTDGGPKIFTIPITAYEAQDKQVRSRSFAPMGFAYAGSSLVAQSVHALASTCLQNLSGPSNLQGPSLKDVADLYLKCAVRYTKEMLGWRPGRYPGFEAFIFGFCPHLKDYLVYHLRTTVDDEMVNIRHDGHYVETGSAFHIGSGVSEFVRILRDYKERGQSLTVWENFELVLTGSKVPSVGGSRQYASVTPNGVQLTPALIPMEGENHSCRIEVLGCDVTELGSVGGFSLAHQVVGPYLYD
jgi:hypothetical protein